MRAFSLIELMVVIAIVALLTAIAVPSYGAYVVRTKVASALPIFETIKAKSINYFTTNGVWPNATELGYTTAINEDTLATPETDLGPIIAPLSSGGSYISEISISSPCTTSYQEIRLVIEAEGPGPFINGAVLGYFRFGADPNGIIIQQCSDDEDSAGEENVYFSSCTYNSRIAFETALCP